MSRYIGGNFCDPTIEEPEHMPVNLSDLSDEEICEYEQYCKALDNPYTDEELNTMQREMSI